MSDTNLHSEPDFILGGRKESIEKAIEIASPSFDREAWNQRHAAWLTTKFDCTAWLTWFIEGYPDSTNQSKNANSAFWQQFK